MPASEIAVLYRINAQSAEFEQALSDAGIVYQVRGGEGFFQRAEIKQAMTQIVRAAQAGTVPGGTVAQQVRAILAPLGLTEREPEGAQARERWQLLGAVADLAEDLTATVPDLDLHGFIREMQRRAESRQPPTVEGVTLASLHAAKGLEWDAVFLVGLVEKTLPISHAIKAGDKQIEEERRLFYVGITRAREHLFLSWSRARQEGGRASRERTRFLDKVLPEPEITDVKPRSKRPSRCRVCGRPLHSATEKTLGRHEDCPSGMDEAVFEALRQWRLSVARELDVAAYMIFTDATLVAIAEDMPENERDLLNIPGIGPAKLQEFGPQLLEFLAQYQH